MWIMIGDYERQKHQLESRMVATHPSICNPLKKYHPNMEITQNTNLMCRLQRPEERKFLTYQPKGDPTLPNLTRCCANDITTPSSLNSKWIYWFKNAKKMIRCAHINKSSTAHCRRHYTDLQPIQAHEIDWNLHQPLIIFLKFEEIYVGALEGSTKMQAGCQMSMSWE